MSIKQNFPVIRPTLNLDFANSRTVDSRIQFTRASAATHIDALGVLQTVRDNKPRIDFDANTGECRGLLIEEQRTNLVTYSEEFSYGWGKTASSVTPNIIVAPNGTITASKLVEDTTAAVYHYTQRGAPLGGSVDSSPYVFSIFAKAGERNRLRLFDNNQNTSGDSTFNLSTGTVVQGTGTITSVGNGWYRCTIYPLKNYSTNSNVFVLLDNGSTSSYTGNGTSGLFIWGAQIEAGTFPTSYVPSTTTFTSRASSATYFDSTGVLRTASTNGARYGFGYDSTTQKWISQGLILEPAATNLIVSSNAPVGGYQSTNTLNASTAPDNSQTAWLNTPGNGIGGGSSTCIVASLGTSPATGTYCYSVFLKPNGMTRIRLYDNANERNVYFNLTGSGSYDTVNATSAGIQQLVNGWYRCWMVGTHTSGNYPYFQVYNGVAGNGSIGVYYWGPQIELGSFPTSYIPTTGSTATRAADVSTSAATTRASETAVITGTNFSNWYNPTQGTLYAEQQVTNIVAGGLQNMPAASLHKNTLNFMAVGHGVGDGGGTGQTSVAWVLNNNATEIYGRTGNFISSGLSLKNAMAYQTNNFAYSANTQTLITDSTITIPIVDTLMIGSYTPSPSYYANGHIKKIAYYPIRLSNTQLQALTV